MAYLVGVGLLQVAFLESVLPYRAYHMDLDHLQEAYLALLVNPFQAFFAEVSYPFPANRPLDEYFTWVVGLPLGYKLVEHLD